MLSDGDNSCAPTRSGAIEVEARVLDIVAETSGLERAEISPGMPVTAALDSLTLAAVVARTEAAFGIAYTSDETLELLAARDLRELCGLIAAKVDPASESR